MPSFAPAWSRLRRHLAGRGEWWWAPVVYALALAWLYRDLWHQGGHAAAFGYDVTGAYGPNLEYLGRDLAHGHFSWWNPYDKGGYPVVGDPECDRYGPLGALFIVISALAGGPWWLIHVKVLVVHLLAACALHLYLRSRGVGAGAATIGGLVLVASAPVLIHKASIVLWPLAFVPLAWLAVERWCARPGLRAGVLVGGAVGLVVTAGSPPGAFYGCLMIGGHAAWRVIGRLRRARRDGALAPTARRLAVSGGAGLAVAALLVAVVVLPLGAVVEQSLRADAHGARYASEGAQAPVETFPALVVPTAGKMSSYVGAMALALALAGLVARPRADGGAPVAWLLMAGVGLVLSFGDFTPVLPWLASHVPGFGRLRVPSRYKLVFAWALAALTAFGVHGLLGLATDPAGARRRRWALAVAGALALIGLVVLAVVPRYPLQLAPRPRGWGALPALAGLAAVAAVLYAPRRRAIVLVVLAAGVVLDPSCFMHTPGDPPSGDPLRRHDGEAALLATLGDVQREWRIFDEFVFADRVGLRRGVRNFRGYTGVDQLSAQRYLDVLEYARHDVAILADYNVRWLLHAPHYRMVWDSHFVRAAPAPGGAFVERAPGRFEARAPAPLVAWYGAVDVEPAERALAATRVAGGVGDRRVAVLEPADAARAGALPRQGPPAVTGRLVRYDADDIVAEVVAPAAGVVVLNELWDPGWTVEVDGVAAPLLRANYLLRATPVGAGAHTLRWRYQPPHQRALLAGAALAWLAALLALVWPRRREVVA